MTLRPRNYLSYSQMVLVEKSPRGYLEYYIYGEEKRTSRAMAYGSKLADSLENDEETGDMLLDLMAIQLPKFELMDMPFETTIGGPEPVPILIKPDSAKKDLSAFKEYKTGVTKWTQKKADESGQVTFYTMGMYLITGNIPQDIELIHLPTEYDADGRPRVTGDMHRFPTQRHMSEILNMMVRARKAWKKIGELCESELI